MDCEAKLQSAKETNVMDCSKCKWPHPDTCKVCKQDERQKEVNDVRQKINCQGVERLAKRFS